MNSNIERNAIFELSDDCKTIHIGSSDDTFYNWSLDISDFSIEELLVIQKLQDKVYALNGNWRTK